MRPNKTKFDILTFPTHEGYQTMLGETDHNFYMLRQNNMKGWDYHTRKLPKNHYIINNINITQNFDMILCQNRLSQWDLSYQLSQQFGIPLIMLDHTEVFPNIPKDHLPAIKARRGDVNVFISEHNRNSWGSTDGIVIRHGIDTELFSGYTGESSAGISVVNQFPYRDVFCGWSLWKSITQKIKVDLVGENPGLSNSISDPVELVNTLKSHRYFLNTSQLSPIPLSVMEAMSVGMPIISTAKQEIPTIVRNGTDGFLSDDPDELIRYAKLLIEDAELAKSMGSNARKNIIENFSIHSFVDKWNDVFVSAYKGRIK